jgi:phosphoribosylaminoimidazole carboxylase
MPRGVPVATVAIGNAKNAGLLAARILGAFDKDICSRVEKIQNDSRDEVERKATRLECVGAENYNGNNV